MATNNNAFAGFTTANDLGEFMVEQDPQTAFMTHLVGQQFRGTNPMQDRARNYFQGQYSNIYNRFLGDRGQEMKSQKDPAKWTTFSQYLENKSTENPYTQRYAARTPYERGVSTRRFAPSTRFITY